MATSTAKLAPKQLADIHLEMQDVGDTMNLANHCFCKSLKDLRELIQERCYVRNLTFNIHFLTWYLR